MSLYDKYLKEKDSLPKESLHTRIEKDEKEREKGTETEIKEKQENIEGMKNIEGEGDRKIEREKEKIFQSKEEPLFDSLPKKPSSFKKFLVRFSFFFVVVLFLLTFAIFFYWYFAVEDKQLSFVEIILDIFDKIKSR